MDSEDLVTVYTAANPVQAGIVKNFLVDEGVHAFIEGENQAAEPGLIGIEIKIQAPSSEFQLARELIESREMAPSADVEA